MSAQRTVGKQWTTAEDKTLVEQVAIYGDNTENWKVIAEALPGRTNKACRKRWKHSLHPSIKKTPWSDVEDRLLLELFRKYPSRWAFIATFIEGRTDDACAKRYREALDPSLKRDDWSHGEDERLLESHSRHGPQWGKVGEELGRSGLGCRNRWRLLERRRKALERSKGQKKPGSKKQSNSEKRSNSGREDLSDDDVEHSRGSGLPDHADGPSSSIGRDIGHFPAVDNMQLDSHDSLPASPNQPRLASPPVSPRPHQPDLLHSTASAIDPSVIGIALGKCSCGCLTGRTSCACSSIIPDVQPNLISSLDLAQLFPYLQAELPNVFVDMPPNMNGNSLSDPGRANNSTDLITPEALLSALTRSSGCGCSCGGPLPGTQSSRDEDAMDQAGESPSCGCCGPDPSQGHQPAVPDMTGKSCCVGRASLPQAASPTPQTDVNAEAAKLVLEYVAFLSGQNPPLPQQSAESPDEGNSPASMSVSRCQSRASSCQPLASQLLINIIDKYQQQRSAATSSTSSPSAVLSRLPALSACCSGSQNPSSAKGKAPCDCCSPKGGTSGCCSSRNVSEASVGPPGLGTAEDKHTIQRSTHEMQPQDSKAGSQTSPQAGGCCSSRSVQLETPAPPVVSTGMGSISTLEPPLSSYGLPSTGMSAQVAPRSTFDPKSIEMPSYIPGCGCGCSENAPAGSCACGCVGVCCCSSGGCDATASTNSGPTSPLPTFSVDPPGLQRLGFSSFDQPMEQGRSTQVSGPTIPPPDYPWTLPDVIPGCGCGCADGMLEGACACGCVGVCRCGLGAKLSAEYRTWDLGVLMPLLEGSTERTAERIQITEALGDLKMTEAQPDPPQPSVLSATGKAQRPGGCCGSKNADVIMQDLPYHNQDATENRVHEQSLTMPENTQSFSGNFSISYLSRPSPDTMSTLPPVSQTNVFGHRDQLFSGEVLPMQEPSRFYGNSTNSPLSASGPSSGPYGYGSQTLLSRSPSEPPRSLNMTPTLDGSYFDSVLISSTGSSPRFSETSASQSRLSGQLVAPLPAYACGHPDCWVLPGAGSTQGSHGNESDQIDTQARMAFSTSAEMVEHRRAMHGLDDDAEPPGQGTGPTGTWMYRCALLGCGKGWKSVNGIQYHLQLSKAHFQSAINAATARKARARRTSASASLSDFRFASPPMNFDMSPLGSLGEEYGSPLSQHRRRQTISMSAGVSVVEKRKKEQYACPHEGCENVYKQSSGLKYHLTHGHSGARPLQLAHVPPALARQIDPQSTLTP